ncbi:MAG: hypothetical protein MZV65_18620 [Chromatiales bacterium]|nr:hypothetical protein [Chromatiales bacterium]
MNAQSAGGAGSIERSARRGPAPGVPAANATLAVHDGLSGRIRITEDHTLLRAGLRALLTQGGASSRSSASSTTDATPCALLGTLASGPRADGPVDARQRTASRPSPRSGSAAARAAHPRAHDPSCRGVRAGEPARRRERLRAEGRLARRAARGDAQRDARQDLPQPGRLGERRQRIPRQGGGVRRARPGRR